MERKKFTMSINEQIVSGLPVEELWAGNQLISTIKVRELSLIELTTLVATTKVRFVVAEIGKPLEWIPASSRSEFWKKDVKQHLAGPNTEVVFSEFPGNYYYFASEWSSFDGGTIVLLTKMRKPARAGQGGGVR
jgi:hypothetical protein